MYRTMNMSIMQGCFFTKGRVVLYQDKYRRPQDMLSKKYKLPTYFFLHKPSTPLRVFHHTLFSVSVYPSDHSYLRMGVVVSNKITKKAVERNTIRRRCFDIVKTHDWQDRYGYDMVLYTKKPIVHADRETVEEALKDFFASL